MKLYNHQTELIDRARDCFNNGAKSVLIQLPTGGGKTVVASHIIKSVIDKAVIDKKERTLLLVAHVEVLCLQAGATLTELGLKVGYVMAGKHIEADAQVYVGMVQTVANRIKSGAFSAPDVLFIDEAHHAAANTYKGLINSNERMQVIGLTATPERADGVGLEDIFDAMVQGKPTSWLISAGYLCPFIAYGGENIINTAMIKTKGRGGDYDAQSTHEEISRAKLFGEPLAQYKALANGSKAIVFSPTVQTSRVVAGLFNEAGIAAAHVDGDYKQAERTLILDDFRAGQVKVLCNVNLFGEGFDVPDAETVILFRPTKSLSLHLQQCGRVLRINPSDAHKRATIIDLSGNCKQHCLPDFDIEWTLEGRKKEGKNGGISRMREYTTNTCVQCRAIVVAKKSSEVFVCDTCLLGRATASGKELSVIENDTDELPMEMKIPSFNNFVNETYKAKSPTIARQMVMRQAAKYDVPLEEVRRVCNEMAARIYEQNDRRGGAG